MADDPTLLGLDIPTAIIVSVLKSDVKLTQTLGACGYAVCLWDNLAYLHQEYRLVWQSKWSPLKVSYLVTRYATLLTGIIYFIGYFSKFGQPACDNYVKAMPAIGTLPILGATLVLVTRAYNLWDNNKAMLAFMTFLAISQTAVAICIGISQTHAIPIYPGYVDACVPTSDSNLYVLYWVLPLLVHTFITVFTMVRAYEIIGLKQPSSTVGQKAWAVVVSKYGQIFPLMIITIEIFQVAFYVSTTGTLKAVSTSLSGFLISVLACQMVLTMRLTTKAGLAGTTFQSSHPTASGGSQPPNNGLTSNISKLSGPSGIQAFITSHATSDKEELDFESADSHSPRKNADGTLRAQYMPSARDAAAANRISGIQAQRIAMMEYNTADRGTATVNEKDKDSFLDTDSEKATSNSERREVRSGVTGQGW